MRAVQIRQFLRTVHLLVLYRGIVPLEAVKVLAALAQHGAVEEATVTVDVRVAIPDQPGSARSESHSLLRLPIGACMSKRKRSNIEAWRCDIKMRTIIAHRVVIGTEVGTLQHERRLHALVAGGVARASDPPTFAASLGHPISPSKALRDGSGSVEFGAVGIADGGGEHGIGVTVNRLCFILDRGNEGAAAGSSGTVPIASGRSRLGSGGRSGSGRGGRRRSAGVVRAPFAAALLAVGLADIAPVSSLDVEVAGRTFARPQWTPVAVPRKSPRDHSNPK